MTIQRRLSKLESVGVADCPCRALCTVVLPGDREPPACERCGELPPIVRVNFVESDHRADGRVDRAC